MSCKMKAKINKQMHTQTYILNNLTIVKWSEIIKMNGLKFCINSSL